MARLTVSQYCTMLEHGYTAEELDNYNREFDNPNPAPEPEPAPAPDPTPEHTPEPENESAALMRDMRELLALMRNSNIRNTTMPTETPTDAAQIMASILAPQNASKK